MKNSNVFIPFNPVLSKDSMKSYIDAKVSEELLNESIERLMKVVFVPPKKLKKVGRLYKNN